MFGSEDVSDFMQRDSQRVELVSVLIELDYSTEQGRRRQGIR